MHVLHLTIPFEYACGITRHVWCLAREQRRRHHVTVVTSGGGAIELLETDGVTWLRLPVDPAAKTPWRAARAAQALRQYTVEHRISVIHAHHRYHALLARAVSWLAGGIPVVATCHYLAPGLRRLSFPVSRVIAVSEATSRFLTGHLRIPEGRIDVVPHCLPPALPTIDPIDPRIIAAGTRPLVVAAGRLSTEKGFETFVRAMAQLLGHEAAPLAVIVGDGPLRPQLESLAAELGAPVLFTGAVRGVQPYLQRATVVVQPSLTETASLSLLEAGALGRAVVATAVGGLLELVSDQQTGLLVPPAAPDPLARAIARLLADLDLRQRLGAGLMRAVAPRLDPGPMVDAVAQVYAAAGAK